MRRLIFLFVGLLMLAADVTAATLPGATSRIDASQYESIQAALDAIPPKGGIVVLPPGTFEIVTPLRLHRGDVRLEGAGTATHIVNKNTQGQPALIVEHPEGENVKRADRNWRVNLANFRITGNEKSGHGIEAIQTDDARPTRLGSHRPLGALQRQTGQAVDRGSF